MFGSIRHKAVQIIGQSLRFLYLKTFLDSFTILHVTTINDNEYVLKCEAKMKESKFHSVRDIIHVLAHNAQFICFICNFWLVASKYQCINVLSLNSMH